MDLLSQPEYLAAGLLALVPLLVYGVPYLRVRERASPALHFLLRRYPTRFQRFRSLNRVLIPVRMGLILVVVALFTLPSTAVDLEAPDAPPESVGLVLVISNSVEMSRSTPEGSLLDLSRRRAAAWVEQSDRQRILVLGTCEGLPATPAWGDRTAALGSLRDLGQAWTWCPTGPLVREARRRWAEDAAEIVVLHRSGGAEPDPDALADPSILLLAPTAASEKTEGGATLLEATLHGDGIRVIASLRAAAAEVSVRCRGEGEPTATARLTGPGMSAADLVPTGLCAGGWWEVLLEPDGLDAGDQAWIPAPERSVMEVLLVDGGFGGRLEERLTRFLEPALRAMESGQIPLRLRVVTQEELTTVRIETADLVILADPRPLRPHLRRSLTSHLESGGALIVTAGPRLARWSDGQGLLPGRWRSADIPQAPGPALTLLPEAGALTAALVRDSQSQSRPVRSRRRLILSGIGGDEADTLVRFDDGVPAVVRWRRGAGTGYLWSVSADLSFGELPLHAVFPLILGTQVREIAEGLRTRSAALRCVVGVPCPVLPLIPPGWDLEDGRGRMSAKLASRLEEGDRTLEPGPYAIRRGSEQRLLAVVDLPGETRRTLAVDGDVQQTALRSQRSPPPTPPVPFQHRVPVRAWLALLAMVMLLFEGWVALRQ